MLVSIVSSWNENSVISVVVVDDGGGFFLIFSFYSAHIDSEHETWGPMSIYCTCTSKWLKWNDCDAILDLWLFKIFHSLSTNAKISMILQSFHPAGRWVDRFHSIMLKRTMDEWTSVIVIVAMPTPTLTQTSTLTPTLLTVNWCETIQFFNLFYHFISQSASSFHRSLLKGRGSKLWINAAPEHCVVFMCVCVCACKHSPFITIAIQIARYDDEYKSKVFWNCWTKAFLFTA